MTTVRRPRGVSGASADDAAARLRGAGHSVGRARLSVIAAVRRRRTAFTAEQLANSVPDVHVATVYRTLALLEEVGVVRHVHLSHGPAIYERAGSPELRHLVCEVCDRHFAVPASVFSSAARCLADEHDFVLGGSHFAIVGCCVGCAD